MSSASDLQNSTLFDLRGRIALVSGGGTGIGLMIAEGLAANGAKVYIGGRRKDVLDKVADKWAKQGKGAIIPYVRSIVAFDHSPTRLSVVVASPLMSRIEIASSRPKNLLKKRRGNCTFWSTSMSVDQAH